ncbi:MAG TPA: efflux RND transporter periplasmic adaptor subunit [Terriglobales bacterium]|nr:efflux RND transporter periplasmic adaptor subunit [Terriglobales bacterium]
MMFSSFQPRVVVTTVSWCVLTVVAVAITGCSKKAQGGAETDPQAIAVKVETATRERAPDFTEYIATLKSRRSSVIQPEVEGQVTRIFVRSGNRVAAGAPLLEIDPRKQEATVTAQEANQRARRAALEYNRQELERRKQLFAAGVISKQELDQAQTAYDASKAEVDALEASVSEQKVQLRYYTVTAPSAGTIGDIPVRVGDRVNTDTVLTTLDEGGELEAYISVPAEKSGAVRTGTPVEIVVPGEQTAIRTVTTFVSPRVDDATQLLLIKASVPNPQGRFRNDEVVRARVIWSEGERVLLPITAVQRVAGQTFAFVVESDGKQTVARQRAMRLGEILGNRYVVLEGIEPGEKVIVTGVQMLADGTPVKAE